MTPYAHPLKNLEGDSRLKADTYGEAGSNSRDLRRTDQPDPEARGSLVFVHSSLFKITSDMLSNPGQFTNAFHEVHSSV